MTPPGDVLVAGVVRERRQLLYDFVALAKPRVAVMVVTTTLVGYYVGLAGAPDYARLLHLVIGTALAAAGAMALNQYWERDVDARMARTRGRPLPDGRLQPVEALAFAVATTIAGLTELAAGVSGLAALVTAAIVAVYVFAYTPLKLRTPLCILVGAVAGALPPVTGWVAAREDLGPGAWALFAIMFVWQIPHTLAIGCLYRDDYARAGVRVLPVVDPHGVRTERHVFASCAALLVVSALPAVLGLAGSAYLASACILGSVFVALAARQLRMPSALGARRILLASLLYLPVLLTALALDKP